jgi:L-cysteine desulfidase
MDLLGTTINAAIVAVVGAGLAWLVRGRFDALDRRIDRMETRLDGRIDALRSSTDAMRSDLTQVALVVGVRLRAQND